MALELRNSATQATPAGPRCFRVSRGILLNPELLFALKWYCSVFASSADVMCWAYEFISGE